MRVDAVFTTVAGLTAVIAIAGCGASSEPQSGSSATETEITKPLPAGGSPNKTVAPAPADREVHKLTGFLSPTGNIGCMIAPAGAGCNVLERDWSPPPRPTDCRLDYERIFIGPGKPPHFVCAGDSSYDSAAPQLAYGEAITAGPIRCESAESGIACRDVESGHGFSVSREAYKLF